MMGQALVELERTVTEAVRRRVAQGLMQARLDVARLSVLRDSFADLAELRPLVVPQGAAPTDVARTRAALQAQAAEQQSKLASNLQQLALHTVGSVVTPAQRLMLIVPADSQLEAEAMISNRDIGFVNVGQPAEIKIDTFNFTRYGLVRGKVLSVSQDSIVREKPTDKQNGGKAAGALAETSEPAEQEFIYSARVSLDEKQMQVEDKMVALAPDMAVTVEIKTGTRRIIEYAMSPLLQYRQESLRER
ncbi:HlyD family efflux transporter periplasmic adaptor subunit [Bradyrhizobium sp. HKCCYLRH1065]|uniref:HlyD family efflux transporter periplasmic adaptor subunit n=1 Tax=Bradyrhizobium sp. HKCCYLRH1065 TaxID=3420753 RepID=UPI003EB94A4F